MAKNKLYTCEEKVCWYENDDEKLRQCIERSKYVKEIRSKLLKMKQKKQKKQKKHLLTPNTKQEFIEKKVELKNSLNEVIN
ncbi:MAG: hypothetical protein BAJALOKI1v1_1590004 [Promethearchaeota archaeon]|nr:MAG: hypothetical protein BAJALOKI1v1_1590004 [Candidatus Lokiarchaeota archaeon]